MVRAYDRSDVQFQLHILEDYWKTNYPSEHKAYRERKAKTRGLGHLAIKKIDELSSKVEALERTLLAISLEPEVSAAETEDEHKMPPIPIIEKQSSKLHDLDLGLRPITLEECKEYIIEYIPVFLDPSLDESGKTLMGNIVGIIEEETGVKIEVDVGDADIRIADIAKVLIEK